MGTGGWGGPSGVRQNGGDESRRTTARPVFQTVTIACGAADPCRPQARRFRRHRWLIRSAREEPWLVRPVHGTQRSKGLAQTPPTYEAQDECRGERVKGREEIALLHLWVEYRAQPRRHLLPATRSSRVHYLHAKMYTSVQQEKKRKMSYNSTRRAPAAAAGDHATHAKIFTAGRQC